MAIAFRLLEEASSIRIVRKGIVEPARLAFGRHAIALDIPQMSSGGPKVSMLEFRNTRLNDDTPPAARYETGACQRSERRTASTSTPRKRAAAPGKMACLVSGMHNPIDVPV
ncbi:MAG: hypothetical protein AB7F74_00195 [Parvibaculaceae bacterium]